MAGSTGSPTATTPTTSAAPQRHPVWGLLVMLASCLAFGTSGPFAKALIGAGWTPGAVVLIRIAGAALVLAPLVVLSLRGRWRLVVRELPLTATYGAFAVAAAQFGYFQAVARLPVAVALLLEYCGIILVVIWVWVVRHRPPSRLTLGGIIVALAGLVLVLDVIGAAAPDLVGALWGLVAATGLAGHYILAAKETRMPAVAFAGLGLAAGGTILAVLGAVGLIPMHAGSHMVDLAGTQAPAWVALTELVLVAAVLAYLLGVIGARHLGSTVASFVGLTEVLFAIVIAWLVLGELPGPMQALGGVVLLTGIVLVRAGDRPRPGGDRPTTGGSDGGHGPGESSAPGVAERESPDEDADFAAVHPVA